MKVDFRIFVASLNAYRADERHGIPKPDSKTFLPASAHKIIESCPSLAHFALVRGDVGEPYWRASLGVIKHTIEGESLCHEWSVGHPNYDRAETQDKIERWTAGPALCDTFRTFADAKCAGCTETCKSPIQLGDIGIKSDALESAIDELNEHHFVARTGGKVFVFDERDDSILPGGMSFSAFRDFMARHRINDVPIAHLWLKSPRRRTYEKVIFDPSGKCEEGSYNTWQGLSMRPKPGNCRMICDHVRNVLCGGNAAQTEYAMKWFALLVQRPWMKPGVALVCRSKEGTGKTKITEMLLQFFGAHGFTAQHKEQVAGRFNGHLFDKVVVVLEEAFFAGDPAAVAAAKALITNDQIGYEAKGKDAFSARSFAHVIILTNNDWAVHAGPDSRRWLLLDVSEARIGDHAYFAALHEEIENGGAEAFLDLLLKMDLAGFNPRILPRSAAMRTQIRETLEQRNPVAVWWLHSLADGAFTLSDGFVDWHAEVPAAALQNSYRSFTHGMRNAPSWDLAAKKLREMLPPGTLVKVRRGQGPVRAFYYQLPDLGEARAHFEKVFGINPCAQ